jgi:hypothetical protein
MNTVTERIIPLKKFLFLSVVNWNKNIMKLLADKANSSVYDYRFTFKGIGLFGIYIGILNGRLDEKKDSKSEGAPIKIMIGHQE